jgi:hypothetical protein
LTKEETAGTTVLLRYFDNSIRYVLGPADLTAYDIASAVAVPSNEEDSGYQVELNLTTAGAQAMDRLTRARYPYYQQNPSDPPSQSTEAIEVGGVIHSVPIIQGSSFNGVAVISYSAHSMTLNQANILVRTIDQAAAS